MPIILWFDDGLESTYTNAYPIMKERGIKGVVAILSDYIGGSWHDVSPEGYDYGHRTMLTLEQVKELCEEGWDIESHSASHAHFPGLNRFQALQELTRSYRWILSHTGQRPMCFAYPWGAENFIHLAGSIYPFIRTVDRGVWDGRSKIVPLAEYIIPEPTPEGMDFEIEVIQDPPPGLYDQTLLIDLFQPTEDYAVWLFHGINDPKQDEWEITPAQFTTLLDLIEAQGERVVTFREALRERRYPYLLRRSPLDRVL